MSEHGIVAADQARGKPGQNGVPQTKAERDRLLAIVRQFLKSTGSVPPFSVDELAASSDRVLTLAGTDERYRKFVAVLISNEAWRDSVAAVPYQQRLLLLPKCLRVEGECAGTLDEFGLVCGDCGRCPIYDLKSEAERLGYAVLVAEGSAPVMALIKARRIEAVIGVSCLTALEAIYPLMESAAIPGIAVPLLMNGCANTTVDLDWVWDAILLTGGDAPRLDLEAMRVEVDAWFTPDALDAAFGPVAGETERIARAWLAKSGKRWRPFLVACVFQALRSDPQAPLPADLRKIALAVECFHKASLIHDDIEDHDAMRYGEKTLHEQYGIPVALNVGDFLLGEGYRMIAESAAPADRRAEMLRVAAGGHRELAIGQGAELCWARRPAPLESEEVLDIFRRKTAPAFEVALRLGAIAAGAADGVWDALHRYSQALGIAYQIRDDLKDWNGEGDPDDLAALRPSILLALAYARARGEDRRLLEAVWRRTVDPAVVAGQVRGAFDRLEVVAQAQRLLKTHKDACISSLEPLDGAALKALLRRVVFRIFHDFGQRGSPSEPGAGHAWDRAAGAEPVA